MHFMLRLFRRKFFFFKNIFNEIIFIPEKIFYGVWLVWKNQRQWKMIGDEILKMVARIQHFSQFCWISAILAGIWHSGRLLVTAAGIWPVLLESGHYVKFCNYRRNLAQWLDSGQYSQNMAQVFDSAMVAKI